MVQWFMIIFNLLFSSSQHVISVGSTATATGQRDATVPQQSEVLLQVFRKANARIQPDHNDPSDDLDGDSHSENKKNKKNHHVFIIQTPI